MMKARFYVTNFAVATTACEFNRELDSKSPARTTSFGSPYLSTQQLRGVGALVEQTP